jgi:predicted DNA-binding transcriptional regulator AlpA
MPRMNTTGKTHRYAANNAELNTKATRPLANPADVVDPFLDARQVRTLIGGVAHSTLWRWTQSGDFPPSAKLGPRRIGWRRSVVVAWMHDRMPSARANDNHAPLVTAA